MLVLKFSHAFAELFMWLFTEFELEIAQIGKVTNRFLFFKFKISYSLICGSRAELVETTASRHIRLTRRIFSLEVTAANISVQIPKRTFTMPSKVHEKKPIWKPVHVVCIVIFYNNFWVFTVIFSGYLKGPSGQIRSAREWYHCEGLGKVINRRNMF